MEFEFIIYLGFIMMVIGVSFFIGYQISKWIDKDFEL